MPPAAASFWDDWYRQMAGGHTRDVLLGRVLGLPPGFQSNNLLPGTAIDEIGDRLDLGRGQGLLDLACGRASWGLHVVAEAGADLVGVDWSQVALRAAATRAGALGLQDRCRFVRCAMDAVGLSDGSFDAAICLDSLQFSPLPSRTVRELRRTLRPGGRVVITGWEPVLPHDPALPPRARVMNLHSLLTAAQFRDITVSERRHWHERERECWQAVSAAPPEDTDGTLADLRREAGPALQTWPRLRRVIAVATAA